MPTPLTGVNAFSFSMEMEYRFQPTWSTACPFLSFIKGKKVRFNNAKKNTTGTQMILPIVNLGPATSARWATNSNATTAIAPTPTQGFLQPAYYYATMENATWLNIQESQQLVGETNWIDVMDSKVDQLIQDFVQQCELGMIGSQNGTGRDGNGLLTGLFYFMSNTNSPGGNSQSTDPNWAAQINSTGGPMTENLITDQVLAIRRLGRGEADFLLLSDLKGNSPYASLLNLIGNRQIITNPTSKADYGFSTFMFAGLECIQENQMGNTMASTAIVGSSRTWWLNMDSDMPVLFPLDGNQRLSGTTTGETMYSWTLSVGNNDIARNALIENIA